MFTSKDVMELRKKTGAGVADCQKALKQTDGDMEKAVDFLREKGMATAAKKASRIAAEGVVYAVIKDKTGVLVEVNCETDFVAKGDQYIEFVKDVANYVCDNDIADIVDRQAPFAGTNLSQADLFIDGGCIFCSDAVRI